MSADLLLLLVVPILSVLVPFVLMRRRRRRVVRPTAAAAPRTRLSFQRPVSSVPRAAEMQASFPNKPPMFANSPAALEGEIAPERQPSSSS